MSAIVGLCLLSEKVVLSRSLTDEVSKLYKLNRGNVKEPRKYATERMSTQSKPVALQVPVSTIILDYKNEDFIKQNPTYSAMDIIGSPSNTAPQTAFQSIMPSLSALFNTPFIQGAFRHRIISSMGPEISYLVMVIGPPSGFMDTPNVSSAQSSVHTVSNADVDLNDIIAINSTMAKSTKLVSASTLQAMLVNDVYDRCMDLDGILLSQALPFFRNYVNVQSKGSLPPAVAACLNTPIKELFSMGSGKREPLALEFRKDNEGQCIGIVLPKGHEGDTLSSRYPAVFINESEPFSDKERSELSELKRTDSDAYEKLYSETISKHVSDGSYGNRVIISHKMSRLSNGGVKIIGRFKISDFNTVKKNLSSRSGEIDSAKEQWEALSGNGLVTDSNISMLHDKILDTITSNKPGVVLRDGNKKSENIVVCFKNGFPNKKHSLLQLTKNGISVVSLDELTDAGILVESTGPDRVRRSPKVLANKLSSFKGRKVTLDVDNMSTEALIQKLSTL
uniref:Protein P7 n=1 Tax=Rice dwarf virus (isolate O) TaxID=142805 RepID=P7_RDVO|nr:RecName: Full=Protein P7; AltName: Full=55 kDa core protein [Rice dwarf virus (isolate O)]1UF2_K Chain K, Structural protein P7 [Rice dwarf virus]BAA00535.1 60K core protein [Rice dwarf virus]